MVEPLPAARCQLELDLSLQRFEGEAGVQSIHLSTQEDGCILVSSQGKLPRGMFRQFNRVRQSLQYVAAATGQDMVIEHEGQRLASLVSRSPNQSVWSFRWWAIAKHLLGVHR